MAIRYERAPEEKFLGLFQSGKLLSGLRGNLSVSSGKYSEKLDLQFRENNEAMLYWGLTRILSVRLLHNGKELSLSKTSPTYKKQGGRLFTNWTLDTSADDFNKQLLPFINRVRINRRYMAKEGLIHVRWASMATSPFPGMPWTPVDREAVLGYDDTPMRTNYVTQSNVLDAIEKEIPSLPRKKRWAKLPARTDHNEVDQIGISMDGRRLYLVEMKSGSDSAAYYAPLQAARYYVEWKRAFDDSGAGIVDGINKLIEAKKKLGLLPKATPTFIADSVEIVPVVAFGSDLPSDEVKSRFAQVKACVVNQLRAYHGNQVEMEEWYWPTSGRSPKPVRP